MMAELDLTAERHRLLTLAEEATREGDYMKASSYIAISREICELPIRWNDDDRQVIDLPEKTD